MGSLELTRAQESRAAIEKIYVEMRHLFNRGFYKPFGISGRELTKSLLVLRPEIYGSINDPRKVELDGLVYVIDRLPKGIEQCRYVRIISDEGYSDSGFETIIPPKRRRYCYRIDQEQMLIEVTRGRSEIYDILTHLTFLYIEAEKIKNNALDDRRKKKREWEKLEELILQSGNTQLTGNPAKNKEASALAEADTLLRDGILLPEERPVPLDDVDYNLYDSDEKALTYLSVILARTFEETKNAFLRFKSSEEHNFGLFHIVYWLGKIAMDEELDKIDRDISFSPALRERIGHHIYGEMWSYNLKSYLLSKNLLNRPIHLISANMHSVMNSFFAYPALRKNYDKEISIEELAIECSILENGHLREEVEKYASLHGMQRLMDDPRTNIGIQIFDPLKMDFSKITPELNFDPQKIEREKPLIIVIDYAFGEQAFEIMDEFLKPLKYNGQVYQMPIESISVMGKAGILEGKKGDIMIPTAHVFEGNANNYPLENDFKEEDFVNNGLDVFEGLMITVLGTSLQNRDVLSYFRNSSWAAIGLEMEGAHYQKAIQAAAKIRKSINPNVTIRYAYYASDNPLVTGSTLASGSLGIIGVKPTYLITKKILDKILG